MRRETDFVLEQAAWPAMLLEENGRICRVNQAARRVFDLPASLREATVALLWIDGNKTPPEEFLREQIAAGTAPLKLRVAGGSTAEFVAHGTKIARDGHPFVLLQLFKDSGAAFPELTYLAPVKETTPLPPPAAGEKNKIPAGLSNAAWPVMVVDLQTVIVRANPEAARLFGAKAAAEGSALAAMCAPEDTATLSNLLAESRNASATSLKFRLDSGTMTHFKLRCSQGDGPHLTLVQLFKTEAVDEPRAAIAKEEDDFPLQNAEWPVLLIRRNGKVLRANRAAVRAFGSEIEKEDGTLASIWSPHNKGSALQFLSLPPSDASLHLKFNLKSGLPGTFLAQSCLTSSDDICLIQLLKAIPSESLPAAASKSVAAPTSPLPTPAPVLPAVAAAAVEASLAHKQKLDCALQLARSVALDFNNALTSILGHASLLLSKAEPGHPWRNSLGEIEKSAAKAAEIANDLAAFSRQEKDVRVQLAGNLNTLLERTVEAFQNSLQKPIKIACQVERKLFTASFDEAKMQQALVKILENAVESIKGEGKINVESRNLELSEPTQDRTAKLTPGSYVCIEISDTGAGIAVDVMPRIFEPFFTTKGSRHRGLGLAWVYGIITNHGGGVALSSQPDAGTSVRIYLPATRKIVRAVPLAPSDLSGTQTILFVDDEDLLLTMGQMILSSYGYTVLTANSGQKALEIFTNSKTKIDLVISDLVMPNMSGRELTEQIRRVAPQTRVVWCSGYVRSAGSEESERFLQKPFTSQDLLRKVKQVLTESEHDTTILTKPKSN
jgi:signal transduction histidine kinase/CheY-like chemotaxis protein/PAS domain-containing protein